LRDDEAFAHRAATVSLITNCYEASYRKVLCAEHWARAASDLRRPLNKRIAIINNVCDRPSVERIAEQLVSRGHIDEYYFVADHIDQALATVGLAAAALDRIPHYTDWALVAIHSCKTDYLIHSDADVYLLEPHDWVTPAIRRLAEQRDALIANPLWNPDRFSLGKIRGENFAEDDNFFVGYGFSDQLFLARTADLQQPIYDYTHPMSLRYPLSHIAPIFEQRLDSYMRRAQKTRLTYKHAGYSHPKQLEGASYPCMQLKERLRWHANRAMVTVYKTLMRPM
jgi:hypothetical protein